MTNETFAEFTAKLNRLWDQGHIRGLVMFEQRVLRSAKQRECIECGDPGTQKQECILVAVVPFYWMCDDCDAYWKAKAA